MVTALASMPPACDLTADLRGDSSNGLLAALPGSIDRAHSGRAQLRTDALRASRVQTAREDRDARNELALRVARILTFNAKLAITRSTFGPRYRNPVLTGQGFDELGFHQCR